MRNTLKNKVVSQIAISGLLVALLCPVESRAETDDPCNKSTKIEPYNKDNAGKRMNDYCKPGSDQANCQGQVKRFAEIATAYLKEIKQACAANEAAVKAIPGSNQAESREKVKNLLRSGEEGTRNLASTAAKHASQATKILKEDIGQLAAAPPKPAAGLLNADDHHKDISTLQRKLNSPDDTVKESDVSKPMQPKVGALRFGSELRKELLEAQRDFNASSQKFADKANELDGKDPSSTDTSADTNTKDKKGGLMDSLNPSTLLGLATAGMGLAAAMKKPSDNSSVSTPSDTTPPAQAVAATGLGGESKSPGQSPNMSTAATKTETPNSTSGGSPGFTGSPFAPESDVTSKGSRLASTGNTSPSSSSGAGGLEGFGSGSGGSRSPDSAAKEAASALAKNSEDPGAGGFSGGGGGGGGGLNFGSSSSTSSDSTHTEDPLKETLQDMAAAVDSGNGSTSTSTDSVQADAGGVDYSTNNEFLFNRIRSTIQRSLKKGGVVSGISNKIR